MFRIRRFGCVVDSLVVGKNAGNSAEISGLSAKSVSKKYANPVVYMEIPGAKARVSAFPRKGCRVDLHFVLFEDCSGFTRAAGGTLTLDETSTLFP